MISNSRGGESPSVSRQVAPKRRPWLFLLIALLIAMPGCGGCQQKTAAQKKKEQDEAKKRASLERKVEPFTLGKITPLPAEVKILKPIVTDPAELESEEEEKRKEDENRLLANKFALNYVKPGHWTGLILPIRSNQADLAGDLIASTIDPKTSELVEVEKTLYKFSLTRPVTLAKGQAKYLESIAFVPRTMQSGSINARFRNEFVSGGRRIVYLDEPTTRLSPYQYFFLVVAANPDQYTFLRVSNFNFPSSDLEDERGKFYQFVAPKFENELPLPIHSATWTNLAYILWDEVDAKKVDIEQQKAMIDWLQFGGQLIVNGPRSLDMLRGTFLDEYLPAGANKSLTIDSETLATLDRNWYIEPKTELGKKDSRRHLELKPNENIAGVELALRTGGEFVPGCGNLVAERRVGRGRVVVTAYPMYHRAFINWSCYDNLLNNAILRRLPREYAVDEGGSEVMRYVAMNVLREDPRVSTTLRYFSRDIGDIGDFVAEDNSTANRTIPNANFQRLDLDEQERRQQRVIDRASALDIDGYDWHFSGYVSTSISGVAGWNDTGACPDAARSALTEAAGIEIPERSFVLRMMVVYLAALVPLNWIVFRLLGRLEWAWIAAPVMAIVAAVAVIRLAQLDIGFARSQTEVNIVEAHGGYDRAHVSRFAALYTSLSSSYRIGFDDPSGIALPFARVTKNNAFMPRLTDTYRTVTMERESNIEISGFGVDSNSTGLLHAEHMLPLGGAFKLTGNAKEGWQVQNDTKLKVDAAIALYRDEKGVLQYAPLGEIASKANASLEFRSVPEKIDGKSASIETALAEEITKLDDKLGGKSETVSRLKLRKVIELACGKLKVAPGEVRLIAITAERPAGMEVRPKAAQINAATLLLIHLKQGQFAAPESDLNLKLDIKMPESIEPANLDEAPTDLDATPGATKIP